MTALPTIPEARGRLGSAVSRRDRAAEADARRDLAAAKIAQYVARTVAAAPPLTDDQRHALAGLLAGPVAGGAR